MSLKSKTIAVYVLCVLGVIWTLLSLSGTTMEICPTSGCKIFHDYPFSNLLNLAGAMAFAIIMGLTFFEKRFLTLIFSSVFMLLDIPLMIFQGITVPCLSCMVSATLIGLVCGMVFYRFEEYTPQIIFVLALWVFGYGAGITSIIGEQFITPWSVNAKTSENQIKVFFSPSCTHCKEIISKMVENETGENIKLYPVARNSDDFKGISRLSCSLKKGCSLEQALKQCWGGECKEHKDKVSIDIFVNSLRNKFYLAKLGIKKVPLIMGNDIAKNKPQLQKGGGCSLGSESKQCGKGSEINSLNSIYGG